MPLDPLMQEIVDTVRAGHDLIMAEIEEARAADARRAALQEAADWLRSRGYHGTAEVMMRELDR